MSEQECYLLRTLYSQVHFTVEQKAGMSEEDKSAFLSDNKEISLFQEKISNMNIDERINFIFKGQNQSD